MQRETFSFLCKAEYKRETESCSQQYEPSLKQNPLTEEPINMDSYNRSSSTFLETCIEIYWVQLSDAGLDPLLSSNFHIHQDPRTLPLRFWVHIYMMASKRCCRLVCCTFTRISSTTQSCSAVLTDGESGSRWSLENR